MTAGSSRPRGGGPGRPLGLSALVALAAACGRGEALRVVAVEPAPGARLRLNEPLRVRFDRPVDPSSVRGGGADVLRADGSRAAGVWTVDGVEAVFWPRLPERPDLGDAGYGVEGPVRLTLEGFPSRLGPMSVDGRPLGSPFRASYDLVPVSLDAPARALFVDPRPGRGPQLVGRPALVDAEGASWIEARFDEPLDPRCLRLRPIALAFDGLDPTPVDSTYSLRQASGAVLLRARPAGGFRRGVRYRATLVPEAIRDLGGRELQGPLPPPLSFEGEER